MEKFKIEPMNEPDGEGNGWHPCAEADATMWHVWHMTDGGTTHDEVLFSAESRAEAESYVAAEQAPIDVDITTPDKLEAAIQTVLALARKSATEKRETDAVDLIEDYFVNVVFGEGTAW